jgi:hypothetical protein
VAPNGAGIINYPQILKWQNDPWEVKGHLLVAEGLGALLKMPSRSTNNNIEYICGKLLQQTIT